MPRPTFEFTSYPRETRGVREEVGGAPRRRGSQKSNALFLDYSPGWRGAGGARVTEPLCMCVCYCRTCCGVGQPREGAPGSSIGLWSVKAPGKFTASKATHVCHTTYHTLTHPHRHTLTRSQTETQPHTRHIIMMSRPRPRTLHGARARCPAGRAHTHTAHAGGHSTM